MIICQNTKKELKEAKAPERLGGEKREREKEDQKVWKMNQSYRQKEKREKDDEVKEEW